jgi:glycosyltransferase involved in cell wall biosynthesis
MAAEVRLRPLRVAIDARIRSGETGGVESVIIGLASGISGFANGDEEYLFLALQGEDDWLRPYVSGPARIVTVQPSSSLSRRQRIANAAPWLADAWRRRPRRSQGILGPPPSDGTIERDGVDVMHFTFQFGFLTDIPSIYHPHDLQHLHLPEFFSAEQRAMRELWYRALCDQAAMVAVASTWTKHDVETQYGLPPNKVCVVPFAPPTAAYQEPGQQEATSIRRRLGTPDSYILYPAQTWPHKNHSGLMRAIALLRSQGLVVPLVAPGQQNEHFAALEQLVFELDLCDQVVWPGFVSPTDLLALYAGATAVVIPSRFEAASAPLWEAFRAGVPAACSNVTSLPEQAGDAALIFDPDDVDGMAAAIRQLWTDPTLRSSLVERGRARIADLSWDGTARMFRAHYRRIAGRNPSDDDRTTSSSQLSI